VRRYSEFEIASTLNRLRRGEPLSAVAKMQDVPERVIRAWENRFLNLSAAEIREARTLKAENRRLRVRIQRLRHGAVEVEASLSAGRADCGSS